MKSLWTILTVVAMANLLMLLGMVGWLASSDRLDMGRLRAIRQVLAPTRAQDRAEEVAANLKAEESARDAAQAAKVGIAPVTTAERLGIKLEESEMDVQRKERARKEIDDLRRGLLLERERLDRDAAAFRTEQAAFAQERQRIKALDGDTQFLKTLTTIEQLKPDKAKIALQQLLDAGQVDQVVAYLDRMQDRTRTKVIDEFLKGDPKVAADLLERVRTRGVEPRVASGQP
ncbi:MAG: hypothetical protein ACKVU4_09600 [Phycisphaerales bacterium]